MNVNKAHWFSLEHQSLSYSNTYFSSSKSGIQRSLGFRASQTYIRSQPGRLLQSLQWCSKFKCGFLVDSMPQAHVNFELQRYQSGRDNWQNSNWSRFLEQLQLWLYLSWYNVLEGNSAKICRVSMAQTIFSLYIFPCNQELTLCMRLLSPEALLENKEDRQKKWRGM